MINSTVEWHWMDDIDPLEESLKGWGFDMKSLRESEGALFSSLDRRSPRANSTNHPNNPTSDNQIPADEWCYYAGMPSPSAYMDNS